MAPKQTFPQKHQDATLETNTSTFSHLHKTLCIKLSDHLSAPTKGELGKSSFKQIMTVNTNGLLYA